MKPDYMNNPAVTALVRQGFEDFAAGKPKDSSPFSAGFENLWWHTGWDAAAINAALKPANQ